MQNNSNVNSFDDLFEKVCDHNSVLTSFLYGHLVIEFLLNELIQVYDPKLKSMSSKMNFQKLVHLNCDLDIISKEQKDLLLEINKVRNQFAHNINYELNINNLRKIFKDAKKAFIDFTDGIEQGIEEMEDKKSINEIHDCNFVISELFIQIAYDLHHDCQRRGGGIGDF